MGQVIGWRQLDGAPSSIRALPVSREDALEMIGDIRALESVQRAMSAFRPEIVIHMAAQPLVHCRR